MYVNGRRVTPDAWQRGDLYAGIYGTNAAKAAGYPGASTRRNAFTPWKPPPIPSGYFDPALDDQRGAASRGLLYTEQDVGSQGRYATEDLGYERTGLQRTYDRSREQNAAAVGQVNEDYNTNVAALQRSFQQLGRGQGEQQRRYGVTAGGGVALLAANKRNENQAIEQKGLDTTKARSLNELERLDRFSREDYVSGGDRLTQLYDRGVAGRGDTLSRARSEDVFYGLGVDSQKQYQAQQALYDAPESPASQRTTPGGRVVQDVVRGGYVYTYDQSGKLINKKKAKR